MGSTPAQPNDDLRFDDRVAVVTGAGQGLGRSHASVLAARGAAVVANDVDVELLDEVVDEIRSSGGSVVPAVGSVADVEGALAVVAAATESFGRLDVVVNNAGILRSADLEDTGDAVWDEVLAVNLRGAFLVARAAWPIMRRQSYGRVVSTTSNSGLLGVAGSSAYAAAKAGVWGLTRALALEGMDHGIRVNAVAPIAYTPMSAESRIAPPAWRSGAGDAWSERLAPVQVSAVVAWLAHEACSVTGEVLSAAGGRVARFFLGLTEGFDTDTLTPELVDEHLADVLDPEPYEILDRASEEGRRLHRRLLG